MTNRGGDQGLCVPPLPCTKQEVHRRKRRDAMEAAEILERARASGEETPPGWLVLPLLKNKLTSGILGWAVGAIIGFGLFAFIASVTIPYNFQQGVFTGCFATALMLITLFIGGGSLWSLIVDARRLRHIEQYLIVITPDDFV